MSGLNIFTSNRLEILAEQLAQIVKMPLSSPFDPEIIVVQSRGMERWISLELARHNRICANASYPFPNKFLEDLFTQMMPDLPVTSPFDLHIMTFKIMKILPACIHQPGFERLNAYLKDDANHLKLFQLSHKIADIYDQYLVFRPEMIFEWEKGKEAKRQEHSWQAQLWRKLVHDTDKCHRARLRKDMLGKITTRPAKISDLPQRVSVFGISYLPPFHIEAFAVLSNLIQMNLFLLNPCREFWGDIVAEKQIQKIKRKHPQLVNIAEEFHLEEGNRLLASMGSHGKQFFALINGFECQSHETYEDPGCHSMLACVQSDILNLKNREASFDDIPSPNQNKTLRPSPEPFGIHESDSSIQIHCCHSPMREIEVLYDNLLAMFEKYPQLLPKDIIVMVPDIELYAPYIQAVFGAQTDERLRIPFGIADVRTTRESRVIECFFSLLDLKGSRLSATEVMQLFEFPGVKEKFDLSESEIQTVERWIIETRIRWGMDTKSRHDLGLPATSENTWRAGIERLLLGYAMPGQGRHMFGGILPYDNIEGDEVQVFGKFLRFTDRVFWCVKMLDRSKRLKHWQTTLKTVLNEFFLPNDDIEREIHQLRYLLDELGSRQTDAGFDEKIEIEAVRSFLNYQLEKHSVNSGFMTGGVTFCAMLPMRSIPFEIICLIGMNADTFPRDVQPLTFDLIAKHPRPGDRCRRNDDKYLFLESIISARQRLYISYIGQSIQDNSHIPPSVLVSELLDTIEKGFYLPEKNILDHVVTYHRLQAFSPLYFRQDGDLFSYSEENKVANLSLQKQINPRPFIAQELPLTNQEEEEWKQLDIERVCSFFRNPIRFLLQHRLGIYLEEAQKGVEKSESFELNALDKYQIGQNLVQTKLAGMELKNFKPVQKALGQMPHGNVGEFHYNDLCTDAEKFVGNIEHITDRKIAEASEVRLDISGLRLQGRLPEIYESGLLQFRYANHRAIDLLKSWIYHLIFCDLTLTAQPKISTLIFKDSVWQLKPVFNPKEILTVLLQLFKQGLSQPIHLFPNSSLEYAHQLQKKAKSKQAALISARMKWLGSQFTRGESQDHYFDLCFKNSDPLDESFQKISIAVFGPLLAHCSELII